MDDAQGAGQLLIFRLILGAQFVDVWKGVFVFGVY